MSKTVLQIGYGMQGKPALADLLANKSITKIIVADASDAILDLPKQLNDARIVPAKIDVTDKAALTSLMKEANAVIELMPGSLTLDMVRLAVEVGVSLVSTMYLFDDGEQDPQKRLEQKKEIAELDRVARQKGITILKEMGMEPGIDFILAYKAVNELDQVKVFHSYGAGFPEPKAANNPLHYKFTWSIIGVIRSCLAPTTIYKNGKEVKIAADELFAPENTHLLKLPEFDMPLECTPNGESDTIAELFGLKDISTMGRYITRWGGHSAFWHVMAKSGFLSRKPIRVGGVEVAPDQFCASLLAGQNQFYYKQDERDVALLRADVRGYKDGKPQRVIVQVMDYRDLKTGFTAMQRTVGYTASIGTQMILDGTLASQKGIISPSDVPFDKFMDELKKRDIDYTIHKEDWNGDENPGA